jgi:hypothetical protein
LRQTKVAFALASSVALLTAARCALAAGMDPTPERLALQPNIPGYPLPTNPNTKKTYTCQEIAADPSVGLRAPFVQPQVPAGGSAMIISYNCLPNNIAWANLMTELGMAIAPPAFHPARTTGLGGFALTFQATYTHINADAVDQTGTQYWHQGTQGSVDPGNHQFSIQNNGPDSILQVYSLNARKGLAYGFEIAGSLGYLSNTSLWVGGGDVHWALLEGFRTGLLGYLPDVAIGGGVRTLGGSPKFFLTTVGIDAQISKPIPLADEAVLTPYVGAQRVIIFANSTVVSLTPNTDPLQVCGYQGTNVPGNPNAYAKPGSPYQQTSGMNSVYNGQPVCANAKADPAAANDFNNETTFQKVVDHRWRGIIGVDYRYEIMYLAAQFATDVTDPSSDNNSWAIGSSGSNGWGSKQWTISLEAGVFF